MSISVEFTNKYSGNAKEQIARVNDLYKTKPPVDQSSSEESTSTETIDDFINSQGWVPPYEYYNSLKQTSSVSSNKEEGFFNVSTNGTSYDDSEEMSYFWLEDFKTWCRFIYYPDYTDLSGCTIVLSIWNGKDGWIFIPNFIVGESIDAQLIQYKDKYGIAKYQQDIIDKACGTPKDDYGKYKSGARGENVIWFTKGWCQRPLMDDYGNWISDPPGENNNLYYKYKQINFLTLVKAIRLQKTTRYTINKAGTFITNRWSSTPSYYKRTKIPSSGADTTLESQDSSPLERYTQTNFCIPISTGIPCIWRLPTGELSLCATLSYNSDPGAPYHYLVEELDEVRKFKKYYNKDVDGFSYIGSHKMLGSKLITASKWLNETCASFFGDGRDKTIEKHWLREYNITESNNSSVSNYDNMLDSSLTFEQHNINKENSMKCSFTVNRPVVTTETIERVDYAKKW